jgi:hypothetical protein
MHGRLSRLIWYGIVLILEESALAIDAERLIPVAPEVGSLAIGPMVACLVAPRPRYWGLEEGRYHFRLVA